MKDESWDHRSDSSFIPHPSSFLGRRSQVVRQRSAKPLFIGSIPIAASKKSHDVYGLNLGLVLFRLVLAGFHDYP